MNYSIYTNKYEGPMDLIFDLISRNKIDISDISIFEITEQYLEYVNNMENIDLELASDFISMASKLVEIKSRYILYSKYKKDDFEDPRNELVQQIEEYKKYRELTEVLRENIKEFDDRFYRQKIEILEDEDIDFSLINLENIIEVITKLNDDIKSKEKISELLNLDSKLLEIVKRKSIPVEDKIYEIRSLILNDVDLKFEQVINLGSKNEVIATFLAVLELIKIKEVSVVQNEYLEEIIIRKNKVGI